VTQKVGVTSSLDVRFLKPLFVEQQIEARCRVSSMEGSRIYLSAEIMDEKGIVCTQAAGSYALMDPALFERLVGAK
jgi:acyl-CoA thioesterase FadM